MSITITEENVNELAKILAEANGFRWESLWDMTPGALHDAVACKAFYRRLARSALMHIAIEHVGAAPKRDVA